MDIKGYKIVRTLGQGGMATVYLAIQESFEREVALKVMSPALSADPTFGERFQREARIVSRLVHPNIVTVYDVGVHEGHHFLSMEYVPGKDLKHRRFELSRKECLLVVKEVAKALDFAGKKGYVHRDVKPENIMLHEEDGRAVLMDFGIARPADGNSGMTQTGTAIGTPHYMSPEQAKGKQVDGRSDIYSLGVVLFLLLEGRVPFDADSAVAVGIKHVSEPVPALNDSLKVFQPIIDKVLAKDPDNRYQTGADFIADLNRIADTDLDAIEVLQANGERKVLDSLDDEAPTVVSGMSTIARSGAQSAAGAKSDGAEPAETVAMEATPAAGETVPTGLSIDMASEVKKAGDRPEAELNIEGLAVSAEEREDREQHDAGGSSWTWLLVLVLVVAAAGGLYYQRQLPAELDLDADSKVVSLVDKPIEQDQGAIETKVVDEDQVSIDNEEIGSEEIASAEENVGLLQAAEEQPEGDLLADGDSGQAASQSQEEAVDEAQAAGSQTADAQTDSPLSTNLMEIARQLREQLESDLSLAPQIAQLYRDQLKQEPGNAKAQWGLKELRDYFSRSMKESIESRDLVQARRYFDTVGETFPRASMDPKYQRLQQRLNKAEALAASLTQAEEYLANNALTSPPGANALEVYRAILAQDSGNLMAQQGVGKIVVRYGDLAKRKLQEGKAQSALTLIDKALAIAPENTKLAKAKEDIQKQVERQQALTRLEREAKNLTQEGKLITPEGDSAYDRFKAMQAQAASDKRARTGLANVEHAVASKVSELIAAEDLDGAETLLTLARKKYSSSKSLGSLQTTLDRALEAALKAAIEASRPRVREMIVSNTKLTSITDTQQSTLRVERTIHIGFRYENFQQNTSVVQAILFDGARSLQIAQVPVIVIGKGGVKFFRIDRPIEGFSDGGYNIDLILGGNRLTSASFRVENNNGI